MAVEVKYLAGVTATERLTTGSQVSTPVNVRIGTDPITIADGNSTNQANKLHYDQVTLAGGANSTINLTSWATGVGASSFAETKGLVILHTGTAGTNSAVAVGGAGSNPHLFGGIAPANSKVTVAPGSALVVTTREATGWTTNSANNLFLENVGNASATLDITVWGE